MWLLGSRLFRGWIATFALAAPHVPARPIAILDEAAVLQAGDAERLGNSIRRLKSEYGIDTAIYFTKSLQSLSIEDFSIRVAEKWKLGRQGQDLGLLLVIAPRERKMRIEVGYGLEGSLPDVVCHRIIEQRMRPAFREGAYARGLEEALAEIDRTVGGKRAVAPRPYVAPPPTIADPYAAQNAGAEAKLYAEIERENAWNTLAFLSMASVFIWAMGLLTAGRPFWIYFFFVGATLAILGGSTALAQAILSGSRAQAFSYGAGFLLIDVAPYFFFARAFRDWRRKKKKPKGGLFPGRGGGGGGGSGSSSSGGSNSSSSSDGSFGGGGSSGSW